MNLKILWKIKSLQVYHASIKIYFIHLVSELTEKIIILLLVIIFDLINYKDLSLPFSWIKNRNCKLCTTDCSK